MRVLLTGGTGFIGRRILVELAARHHEVVATRRAESVIPPSDTARWIDASDTSALQECEPIDGIIHAATNYGRDGEFTDCIETNIALPLRLIEGLRESSCPRFVHCNTCFTLTEPGTYRYLTEYQLSKSQMSAWGNHLASLGKIDFCDALIFQPYGPGDHPAKFVPWIMKELASTSLLPIELTEGNQIRDFIHVDDVAKALVSAVEIVDAPPIIHVGTGAGTSIREFVELAHGIVGSNRRLAFGACPQRDGEVPSLVASDSLLLHQAAISLGDGLQRLSYLQTSGH